MATAPTITYLLLDAQNDVVFDPSAALVDAAAVSQAILTRLRLWQGEWWENLNLGLPVTQKILGQLASKQGIAQMSLLIQQQIEGVPYVTAVLDVATTYNNGALGFTAKAQTQFGVVVVTYTPGNSASLDT